MMYTMRGLCSFPYIRVLPNVLVAIIDRIYPIPLFYLGIDNGKDLPREMLESIFDSIVANQFTTVDPLMERLRRVSNFIQGLSEVRKLFCVS